MTLTPAARAARQLQGSLDAHALWNLEANVRDLVAGFDGAVAGNAALHERINAVRSVVRHLREEARHSQDVERETAYLTAAEWLDEALKGVPKRPS